ncbi:MAG: HNH endonuclease [Pyrinomonadaceae bacterium]|jgi:hypothetical protein|nr:HNH endonuclease [Pyrinomonadaceae bacterium]
MSVISEDLKNKVREIAKNRCGYCLTPQNITAVPLEIEHIFPISKGGNNELENLWLSCRNCNGFKYTKTHAVDYQTNLEVEIFNPRKQNWHEHFEFSQDKTEIIGKTPCGRATVVALNLNFEQAIIARSRWVKVNWYPPED